MRVVKQRIRRWTDGNFMGIWSDVCNVYVSSKQRKAKKQKISESSLRSSNTIRARLAVEAGQYHKAIQFSSSNDVAPANDEVF